MSEAEKHPDHVTVFLLLDTAMGAYFHYCSQLGNALAVRPDVESVKLLAVFAPRGKKTAPSDESALLARDVGLKVLVPGLGQRPVRLLHGFWNLMAHLREIRRVHNPVLHVHTATGFDVLDFLLLALHRLFGARIVRTVHEVSAAERIAPASSLDRRLATWQLTAADVLIVHDRRTQRALAAELDRPERAIVVTPHGNYLTFRSSNPDTAPPCRDSATEFELLFLGIKRNKGIEQFLEAMARLEKTEPTIRALIAGQVTPGDEDLVDWARSLGNVTVEVGYVRNDELWRVFSRAGAVVLPYLRGTTSGAVHLAFAFCRPVIVTNLPCFEDIVAHGENGLVVPRGDVEALTQAIVELCRSPIRRKEMAKAGFKRERSPRYRWEAIAEATVETYRPR